MTVRGHVTEVEAESSGTVTFWLQPPRDRRRLIKSSLNVEVSVGEHLEVTGMEDPDGYLNAESIEMIPPFRPAGPVPLPNLQPNGHRRDRKPIFIGAVCIVVVAVVTALYLIRGGITSSPRLSIARFTCSPSGPFRYRVYVAGKAYGPSGQSYFVNATGIPTPISSWTATCEKWHVPKPGVCAQWANDPSETAWELTYDFRERPSFFRVFLGHATVIVQERDFQDIPCK